MNFFQRCYNVFELRKDMVVMKKNSVLLIITIISITVSVVLGCAFIYKTIRHNQQKDIVKMFGEDKYVVEIVDDTQTVIYTLGAVLADGDYNSFEIAEQYLNKLGYKHQPDERLGSSYSFVNEKGENITCVVENHRSFSKWTIYFK